MKRILLCFVLISLSAWGLKAQNCSAAKKAECSSLAKKHCHGSHAALAAAQDQSVLSVFDSETMTTKYVRQDVCTQSGSVSFSEVVFDEYSGQFITPRSYNCSWKSCLKNPNCAIKPMSKASVQFRDAVASLESAGKKRT